MSFLQRKCGLVLALLLLASLSMAGDSPSPDLALRNMSGNPQSLRQYRGKIVVLNFWATWCEPCRDEMPMLVEAQELYTERGLVGIGASLDDSSTRSRIAPFIRKRKINFPVWVGATPAAIQPCAHAFDVGRITPSNASTGSSAIRTSADIHFVEKPVRPYLSRVEAIHPRFPHPTQRAGMPHEAHARHVARRQKP